MKVTSTSESSISNGSTSSLDCDATDFKLCVFAETLFVPQEHLATTITNCLRIQDTSSPDSQCRRDKDIVGHSIIRDAEIIQQLTVNLHDIPPVLVALSEVSSAWLPSRGSGVALELGGFFDVHTVVSTVTNFALC
jgi:hypothetical protein